MNTWRTIPWPVWISGAVVTLIVLAAAVPELLSSVDPSVTSRVEVLRAPSASHVFGTDELGRDVYARTVYAARISLSIGVGATAIGFVLGSAAGMIASGPSRVVDAVLMRLVDILLAFPGLLLALLLIAVMGPGSANATIAIGLASVPHYARLVRSQAMVVRRSGYVVAARTLGQRPWELAIRHVVPNALAPLVVLATLGVGTAVIAGSGLSFLGLGAVVPTPEWGSMLAEGRNLLPRAWWLAIPPGACITASAISVTVLGRYWQLRLEGRHQG